MYTHAHIHSFVVCSSFLFLRETDAVDGKHIHIQNPLLSMSLYLNYKRTFTTMLMGVADADHHFICLDVGSCDRGHDGSVFAQCAYGKALENGILLLPQSEYRDLSHVFVGEGLR